MKGIIGDDSDLRDKSNNREENCNLFCTKQYIAKWLTEEKYLPTLFKVQVFQKKKNLVMYWMPQQLLPLLLFLTIFWPFHEAFIQAYSEDFIL